MTLPPETPREWRARVALIASIGGAIAMTVYAAVSLYMLGYVPMWADRVPNVTNLGMLALAGALIVLGTLGMAINRRTFKLSRDGIEASGGDDEDETP